MSMNKALFLQINSGHWQEMHLICEECQREVSQVMYVLVSLVRSKLGLMHVHYALSKISLCSPYRLIREDTSLSYKFLFKGSLSASGFDSNDQALIYWQKHSLSRSKMNIFGFSTYFENNLYKPCSGKMWLNTCS